MKVLDEVASSDLLVFAIDDRRYGLPAREVVELSRAVAIYSRPEAGANHLLEGVVNLHGELAAAVNLRSRFGHQPKSLSPSEHFIFTRAEGQLLALRADRILEIISPPADALDSIPRRGQQQSEETFAGVCKLPQGLIFIFDLGNFLSASETKAIREFVDRAAHHEDDN